VSAKLVAPVVNRLYRRLATGRVATGVGHWTASGLPIRETADGHSAVQRGRTGQRFFPYQPPSARV